MNFDNLSLLNFTPFRIANFAEKCGMRYAYAPVEDNKVLLVSSSWSTRNILEASLIEILSEQKYCKNNSLNLGDFFEDNHKLEFVYKDADAAYFAAHSKPQNTNV